MAERHEDHGAVAHKNGLKLNLYLMDKVTWDTREYLKTIWNEHRPDMWRNDFQDTDLNVQAWAQDNCPKNLSLQHELQLF